MRMLKIAAFGFAAVLAGASLPAMAQDATAPTPPAQGGGSGTNSGMPAHSGSMSHSGTTTRSHKSGQKMHSGSKTMHKGTMNKQQDGSGTTTN